MGFSFVRSLVKHTLKHCGNALGGGIVPIGSIASAVFVEWSESGETPAKGHAPGAAAQARVRAELEKIVQDARGYRAQVDRLLADLGAGQPEAVRQVARAYLGQLPGRVQGSLRRPDDPSGRTVPAGLLLHRAEDVQQLLPERMPRFRPGDRPVPGTDLVIEELLGAGGFGEVWKASHQSRPHAPPVALKFCIDEAAARTLRKEVELLDRVRQQGRHRGIVELLYAHLEVNPPCLEYEYVDGGDLSGLVADLHRAGKGTPLTMTRLFFSLAQAVGVAHRIKPPVVHRDLKPSNILTTRVEKRVVLKVADFGIGALGAAQVQRGGDTPGPGTLTQSAGTCTPLYASPQQLRGDPADPRDDVYALGVIWHQLLTGDLGSGAPSGMRWSRDLSERGMPQAQIDLLASCFESNPAHRPANAAVLAEQLSRLLTESAPPAESVAKPSGARPEGDAAALWFLGAGIGALAAAVSLSAIFLSELMRHRPSPEEFFFSMLVFLLFLVVLPGAVAVSHFRASGCLKNFHGKGSLILATVCGIVLGLLCGLGSLLYWFLVLDNPGWPSRSVCFLVALVMTAASFLNCFAAIRGILVLTNARLRDELARPRTAKEKPRPVFSNRLLLGVCGGLAGWFLLLLLLSFSSRPRSERYEPPPYKLPEVKPTYEVPPYKNPEVKPTYELPPYKSPYDKPKE